MMLAVSLALQGPAALRLASWTEIPMKSKLLLVALMASAAFFTLLGYELMRARSCRRPAPSILPNRRRRRPRPRWIGRRQIPGSVP